MRKYQFLSGFFLAVILVICTAQTTMYYVTPTQATNVVIWVAGPLATNVARYWVTNYAYPADASNLLVALENDTNHVNFRFYEPQLTNITTYGPSTNNDTFIMQGINKEIVFLEGGGIVGARYIYVDQMKVTNDIRVNEMVLTNLLTITSLGHTNSFETLGVDSNGMVIKTNALPSGTNYYSTNGGNGTDGYIVKWGGTTNLEDSLIYQDGVDGLVVTGRVNIATDNIPSLAVSNSLQSINFLTVSDTILTIGETGHEIQPYFKANQEAVVGTFTNFPPAAFIRCFYGAGSVGYIPVLSSPNAP